MNDEVKLHLALMQVHNCISLLSQNEYSNYMSNKLYLVKYELERQLKLLTKSNKSTKIGE